MTRYEFQTVTVGDGLIPPHFITDKTLERLNELGAEGWSVVSSFTVEGRTKEFLLQRPKKDEAK